MIIGEIIANLGISQLYGFLFLFSNLLLIALFSYSRIQLSRLQKQIVFLFSIIVFNVARFAFDGIFKDILLLTLNAWFPEILITAIADFPVGVASANIVSFLLLILYYVK